MTLIICDIDGTISDCQHRQHLAAARDWDAFHQLAHLDEPISMTLDMIRDLVHVSGHGLIFLTGRPEWMRELTLKWLADKCELDLHDHYLELLMRPKDEWAPDYQIKLAMLKHSAQFGAIKTWAEAEKISDLVNFDNPSPTFRDMILFLDDRDKVVEAFRNLGFHCWQTAQGAF